MMLGAFENATRGALSPEMLAQLVGKGRGASQGELG